MGSKEEKDDKGGRQVQNGGSVGLDGKVDEGKGGLRLVTFDDLGAIMDINDNIYDGLDYMPTLFYTFMQSKLHFMYVYEEDGKLVSLVNYRLHPDRDDLVSGMSGRVRPSHRNRGLGTISPLVELRKVCPTITKLVVDVEYTPTIRAKMKEAEVKVNYHCNVLICYLDDRQWLNRIARSHQMTFDSNRPFSLSYSTASEWLERSDQLSRFLSKYVTGLFPCGTNWTPTPLNRSGLRHMVSSNKVYATMDTSSTMIDNSLPDHKLSVAGLGPKARTSGRGQEGDLVGLSYSTACPCKYGIRIDIFFYGDNEQVFLSHMYSHLLHYINVTSDDVRFGVNLNFTQTISLKKMEELLRKEMGERFLEIESTEVVQFTAELARAKL